MARFGWRAFFVTLGFVSLLWLIPWFTWMPRVTKADHREQRADLVGIAEILSKRSAWFSALGAVLLELLLVFPGHLAARLSRTRAPLPEIEDGGVRLACPIWRSRSRRCSAVGCRIG